MTCMLLVHAVLAALCILFLPSIAHAWGPGMHVETALAAIAKVSLAAPFIRELIRRFPDAFIYGATSPDIVVGKKYAGYLHHCHNWRIGWLILHEAKSDCQRAAAYGYLMHLAADVVGHNYYIPVKIVRSYTARLLSHTYWEMRFDLGVSDEAWRRIKKVRHENIEEFDSLLERVLSKTLFSFSTNKRIFNTILILQKMQGLRSSLKLYASHSRFGIEDENRRHYADLTMESTMEFLAHPESAACLHVDPTGVRRLAYAKDLRRNLRAMMGRGLLSEERARVFVELVKEQLAVGLYRPEMKLPVVADVL
ncbi:MAG: zinc dependent phospholipase C family protein [Pseudomonadota bacterium]